MEAAGLTKEVVEPSTIAAVSGGPIATTSVAPTSSSVSTSPAAVADEEGVVPRGEDKEGGGCSCRSPSSSLLSASVSSSSSGSAAKPRTSCCLRAVISSHKFGTVLKSKFFDPYPFIVQQPFRDNVIPDDLHQDYRHVAFVRNLYSALVSGYLYHKSGRECWLDHLGRNVPWNRTSPYAALGQTTFEWMRPAVRKKFLLSGGPTPPRNNRTLCQYLADESMEDGMRVYMGVANSLWYARILPYLDKAQQRQIHTHNGSHVPGNNHTLFVCLEEASNPQQEEAVFDRVVDWLYPGGHNLTFPESVSGASGHETPHDDPDQRRALMDLAKQYDQEHYGYIFRQMNGHFRCIETL